MSKKIIYFIEIIIIIIGLILNYHFAKHQVFYKSFFITFSGLILTFIMSKSFLKLYLKDKRNISNNNSFTTLIVTILFALIIGVSIFSLINNSIIFLGNKKSKIECIKIVNKEINKTHGVRYYYVLDNIAGHKDVKIQISKKTFNNLKESQYIKVKYYSIGNLIKYVNRDEMITGCPKSD